MLIYIKLIYNFFSFGKKYLNENNKLIKSLDSDGKTINIYNNKKEVIFQSGARKEIFEDGFQIVYFINGDKKINYIDGKTVYYFNDQKTVQTTFSNGLQVFKFSNGQIEKHFPDKTKQICFPNGAHRFIKSMEDGKIYYINDKIETSFQKRSYKLKK